MGSLLADASELQRGLDSTQPTGRVPADSILSCPEAKCPRAWGGMGSLGCDMKVSGSMGQGVFIPEKGPPGRTKSTREESL